MNQYPQMVYKAGGPHEIHGGKFDYLIVQDSDELVAALGGGWALTTDEARAPAPLDDSAPPTRAELEAKAADLGVQFSPNIGDAKLAERIEAALAAKD